MDRAKLTHKDAIELLDLLIATPSISREEDKTADLICRFMQTQGIPTYRHFNNVWAKSLNYDSAKPTLLLNSHHDTVKPSPAYTNPPFQPIHKDGRIYGLGSNDAGASVVSLITTFCNHYDANLPFNLILLISAEEEVTGEHGMRAMLPYFKQQGINIDMALVGEPTGLQAAIGERGLVVLDCTAHGKQGHAARNEGVNAIYKAIDDIQKIQHFQFERTSTLLGPIKMTATMIQAGQQHNVVPDTCSFVVDIRTTDAYSNEETVKILQEHLTSDLRPRSTHINASAIDAAHPLVVAAKATGADTFVSPTTSDMAVLRGIPSLKLGIGESSRSHSADEFVLEKEIADGIAFYEKYIENLLLQL
ncbi:MAG: M20 family metallo-hydrolase [Prevotellaceae bacterium]|nr:M20 family metallo-hydrolase [Prevotellaceae bacterium]